MSVVECEGTTLHSGTQISCQGYQHSLWLLYIVLTTSKEIGAHQNDFQSHQGGSRENPDSFLEQVLVVRHTLASSLNIHTGKQIELTRKHISDMFFQAELEDEMRTCEDRLDWAFFRDGDREKYLG